MNHENSIADHFFVPDITATNINQVNVNNQQYRKERKLNFYKKAFNRYIYIFSINQRSQYFSPHIICQA